MITREDLEIALAPIKRDLTLLKWMLRVLRAEVTALILFFAG